MSYQRKNLWTLRDRARFSFCGLSETAEVVFCRMVVYAKGVGRTTHRLRTPRALSAQSDALGPLVLWETAARCPSVESFGSTEMSDSISAA